jgi:UDP-glucose 4-epimerase
MAVVVTGATGFIGTALSGALARAGIEQRALSADANGAVLLHLGETADAGSAERDGDPYVAAQVALARQLADKGFSRIVYASSALVYGDGAPHPRRPDEPPQPGGIYARAKLAVEEVVIGLGGTVLRLANVYGPGMARNNVMSDLLRQVPGTGPVVLRDASPVRDFVWVDDVAAAFMAAAAKLTPGVFNVGTGIATSAGELAALVLRLAGQSARGVQSANSAASRSTLVLDPAATEKSFGWRAKVPLAEGISRLLLAGNHVEA